MERLQSDFKCFEDGTEQFVMERLEVPEDVVEGSQRAWVHITGDIMAPALENVGGLVSQASTDSSTLDQICFMLLS